MTEDESENKVTRNNSILSVSKSNILTENLVQLMSDVDDLKQQINFFADEKCRDENAIK